MNKLSPDAQELIESAQLDLPPSDAKAKIRAQLAERLGTLPEAMQDVPVATNPLLSNPMLLKVLSAGLFGALGLAAVLFFAGDLDNSTAVKAEEKRLLPTQIVQETVLEQAAPAKAEAPSPPEAPKQVKLSKSVAHPSHKKENQKSVANAKRVAIRPKAKEARGMPSAHAQESQLVKELKLIGKAESEFRGRHFERALIELQAHEDAFYSGKLQAERELLRILVYCAQVNRSKAKKVARALLRVAPQATVRSKIADTCARDVTSSLRNLK